MIGTRKRSSGLELGVVRSASGGHTSFRGVPSFGGGDHLYVRYILEPDFPSPTIRAYLRFELSSVPAGATLSAATLRMYQDSASYEQSVILRAWRVTSSWFDNGVGISNQPT